MRTRLALLLQALIIVLVFGAPAVAQDKPRYGGELFTRVVNASETDPPARNAGMREAVEGGG